MNKNGFTLLETLVCMAVISVLTAIMTPAFQAARRSAQVSASLSNLRQMHVAVALYREAAEAAAASHLGLPTSGELLRNVVPTSLQASPCGWNPMWAPVRTRFHYLYWPGGEGPDYAQEYALFGEQAILLTDEHCNPHDVPSRSPYFAHLGLGVRLDGTLVRRKRTGDPSYLKWWRP